MSDEPKVHVGVGNVVEKPGMANRQSQVLPASRRCLANIPQNLNDMWWRDAKVDKPVDGEKVQFCDGHGIYSGSRAPKNGVFYWADGSQPWADADVTHWMPQPDVPK